MANQFPTACIAPPLDEAQLKGYQQLCNAVSDRSVKAAMQACLACISAWWKLPESQQKPTAQLGLHHQGQSMRYDVVPLESGHVEAIKQHVPSPKDLDHMGSIFDGIHSQKQTEVRNAVFHLLWYVKELSAGREPITTDKLQLK